MRDNKEHFKQTCVFADFKRLGDVDVFEMKSGRTVVAKLVDIDSADYQWTADDTGQRDLTWEIIDVLTEWKQSPINLNWTLRMQSGRELHIDHIDTVLARHPFTGRSLSKADVIRREYLATTPA